MPSYNSEKFIGVAIESVIKSTYSNFELIITDDCSTDRTYDIAKSYEQMDSRIKVFKNDRNYGDYPNRNRAANYAKGKYIKYVDHDDYIYPHGLEQLLFYMEQFPSAGYGLCSLDQDPNNIYPLLLSPEDAYRRNYFRRSIFHKAPLSSIIRLDAFNAIGGFTGKPLLGDFEMWHLLSQKFPVLLMPHGIVWYREHENQESKKLELDPRNTFNYLLVQKELLVSDNCPLSKKERTLILNRIKIKEAKSILSACRRHSFKIGIQLQKASGLGVLSILKYGLFYKWIS